jgi:hypothetical protein
VAGTLPATDRYGFGHIPTLEWVVPKTGVRLGRPRGPGGPRRFSSGCLLAASESDVRPEPLQVSPSVFSPVFLTGTHKML